MSKVHLSLIASAVISALVLGGCNSSSDTTTLIQGNYELNTNLGTPVTFTSYDKTQTSKTPLQQTIGYGSSATHSEKDPANVVYTMSDRGSNIKCEDSGKAPVDIPDFCGEEVSGSFVVDNNGKIFPEPSFDPSIYQITFVQQGGVMVPTVTKTIPLKDASGNPIQGLSNDLPDRPEDLTKTASTDTVVSNTEKGYDINAQRLPFNQNSLDTEDIAIMPDGSFWIGEEYAPSILHVAADGTVLQRVVPNDSGVMNPITGQSMSVCDALKNGTANTAKANYPITCGLPGILDLRSLNRGIEDIAVSADGKTLYFGMQSPLANPSKDAYKKSRNARIFTVSLNSDSSFNQVTGEYVYQLDTPDTFAPDTSTKQNDVKLSDMSMTQNGHLIQLERISKDTKLYHVDFTGATNILNTKWDEHTTQPSLTQQADLSAAGITPVKKTLVFSTGTDYPDATIIGKVEGVTQLDSDFFMLVNDNDFGIGGLPTEFNIIKNAAKLTQ